MENEKLHYVGHRYIGVKIVNARPETENEFRQRNGRPYVRNLLIIVALAAVSLGVVGCQPQSITPAQIKQQVTEKRAALLDAATQLQTNAAQLSTQLQAAGITDANITSKIAAMNAQAAKYIADANNLAVALSKMELTGDTTSDWITTIGTVNNSIPSPAQPYVNIGLTLAGLIAAGIAKKKATQAAAATLALTETVKGVQDFKIVIDTPTVIDTLKTSLSSAQSATTKEQVATIKANL
jgi:hypothetical protein